MMDKKDMTLCKYYKIWVDTYKKGAVRDVTLRKYLCDITTLESLVPDMKLSEVDRTMYQQILNTYAETHEKVTVMDFHHHLKAVLMDAREEGYLDIDPTRRAVIKGKAPREKKIKYLSRFELDSLLRKLELTDEPSWDWLILLLAKTGIRFSEALAVTSDDFDFKKQRLTINKTWDYKNGGGFVPTKNKSSVRTIQIDWQLAMQFYPICSSVPKGDPLFQNLGEGNTIYNATANGILERRCKAAEVPVITIHGLRHTHASLLLSAGVSIASVAQRLGHSNMATTQKVYLHVIKELENKDTGLIMSTLTGLGG